MYKSRAVTDFQPDYFVPQSFLHRLRINKPAKSQVEDAAKHLAAAIKNGSILQTEHGDLIDGKELDVVKGKLRSIDSKVLAHMSDCAMFLAHWVKELDPKESQVVLPCPYAFSKAADMVLRETYEIPKEGLAVGNQGVRIWIEHGMFYVGGVYKNTFGDRSFMDSTVIWPANDIGNEIAMKEALALDRHDIHKKLNGWTNREIEGLGMLLFNILGELRVGMETFDNTDEISGLLSNHRIDELAESACKTRAIGSYGVKKSSSPHYLLTHARACDKSLRFKLRYNDVLNAKLEALLNTGVDESAAAVPPHPYRLVHPVIRHGLIWLNFKGVDPETNQFVEMYTPMMPAKASKDSLDRALGAARDLQVSLADIERKALAFANRAKEESILQRIGVLDAIQEGTPEKTQSQSHRG